MPISMQDTRHQSVVVTRFVLNKVRNIGELTITVLNIISLNAPKD